jgi:quercetin dioxygenase-like cupin family protein
MYITRIDPKAAINDPTLAPYFSGPALQQVVTPPEISPELDVRAVYFAKGARSQWHRHPFPQVIHVLSGMGLVGDDDGEREVRPGEIVTFAAQTWHWHGASPDAEMHMISMMRPGLIEVRKS